MQAQARICPICYDDHQSEQHGGRSCHRDDLKDAAIARDHKLTAAQARIEKLERMVVWMANSGISFTEIPGEVAWFSEEADKMIYIPCDGTAPSILAAVEKAMGE